MLGVLAGCGLTVAAAGAMHPRRFTPIAASAAVPSTTTTAPPTTTTTTTAPVVVAPPTHVFPTTGNAQLDALLPTLPALLFEAGAHVHAGWNPLDACCHAGGYNPDPNDVWIGQSAFASPARLRYVVVHELAHSLHFKTPRGPALGAAVAGAPSVRPGDWDVSEKVADCAAWVLAPAETAASGITYWSCADPWRSQVRVALQ